jgi:YjbE family integral membrane protein
MHFFANVASIILIDLLLAGDNAVVIAMASRQLPPEQRKKAILYGALAAVLMRVVLTFFVSQLLQVSFVKLVGGVLILWIAAKLFVQEGDGHEEGTGKTATSIWGAVKLILIADATMSLDNMLAVGGASHGSLPLLLFGLAVSVPFVVFTSNLLSKLMDRFPIIVYAGAAVLGKVSAEMILTDPFTDSIFHPSRTAVYAAEAIFALGVVIGGKLWARRVARLSGPSEAG